MRVGQSNRFVKKEITFQEKQQQKHMTKRNREMKIRSEKAKREKRVALELDFIKKLKGSVTRDANI